MFGAAKAGFGGWPGAVKETHTAQVGFAYAGGGEEFDYDHPIGMVDYQTDARVRRRVPRDGVRSLSRLH